MRTITWNPEETGVEDCGNVSWELSMLDGSLIDATVFMVDFLEPTKILEVYSKDESKLGIYEFEVKVYYVSKPSISVSGLF